MISQDKLSPSLNFLNSISKRLCPLTEEVMSLCPLTAMIYHTIVSWEQSCEVCGDGWMQWVARVQISCQLSCQEEIFTRELTRDFKISCSHLTGSGIRLQTAHPSIADPLWMTRSSKYTLFCQCSCLFKCPINTTRYLKAHCIALMPLLVSFVRCKYALYWMGELNSTYQWI